LDKAIAEFNSRYPNSYDEVVAKYGTFDARYDKEGGIWYVAGTKPGPPGIRGGGAAYIEVRDADGKV
jgi:hypothetical protein